VLSRFYTQCFLVSNLFILLELSNLREGMSNQTNQLQQLQSDQSLLRQQIIVINEGWYKTDGYILRENLSWSPTRVKFYRHCKFIRCSVSS